MIAFYRALLRLYPASFRVEYGEELCAVFSERVRHSSRSSAILSALADVIPNAAAVHVDVLKQDLRYGMRTVRHSPGFAFTAILVVALGIGASTAAFSLADFVLLRPLPFPDSDRLVKIWNSDDGGYEGEVSPPNYRDWKAMATESFSGVAAYAPASANLVGIGTPRRVSMSLVAPELFPLIGTAPMLGSVITPANWNAGRSVVLSYQLWQSQFGGDPGVIGRVVRLDGEPRTIIGVMPAGFRFPRRDIDLWTQLILPKADDEDRTNSYFEVIGRLKPGVTLDAARAEVAAVGLRLQQQYPDTNKDLRVYLNRLRDRVGSHSRLLLIALCGAALCILLLACANLATLMLARGAGRARELAIRTTLGADRDRLVRQLVTESVLLSLVGGSLGVFLAWAGLPLLAQLVPPTLPVVEVPAIDLRILASAAVLMALTSLGFGILPALQTHTFTSRQRLRSALVMFEITGCVVLLIASGLLMRAIWRVQSVPAGFRAEGVMTMATPLPVPKYANVAPREAFYKRVLDEVRAIPGVTDAAYITGLPMARTGGIWSVEIPGVERKNSDLASLRFISPQYFKTMGIPLLRGRDVADSDTQNSLPVAVVSESMARRYWPNRDPLGQQFKFGALKERTVVGVVGDVRVRGLERESEPQVYLASAQVQDNAVIGYIPHDLVIRSTLPADRWLGQVRHIIESVDPEQPISNVRPLSEIVAGDTAPRRIQLRVLLILSAIALLIAGVGIHGLLSYAVSQRTKELGVRRVLGAQASVIVAMVLRQGFILAVAGAAAGIVLSMPLDRAMRALLFGIEPMDVRTVASAAAVCLVTAILGCVRPAIRAAHVDPIVALREN